MEGILWIAAYTIFYTVVEVLVIHVPRVQAPPESPVLQRRTLRMQQPRRMPEVAELALVRHRELGRWFARSVDSACHGPMLPDMRLSLFAQENKRMSPVIER